MEHTSGEWKARRLASGPAFTIEAVEQGDRKRWEVAEVFFKPTMEEAQANARLIAQAPSMYEALRYILDLYKDGVVLGDIAWERAIAQAHEALRKAEPQ